MLFGEHVKNRESQKKDCVIQGKKWWKMWKIQYGRAIVGEKCMERSKVKGW